MECHFKDIKNINMADIIYNTQGQIVEKTPVQKWYRHEYKKEEAPAFKNTCDNILTNDIIMDKLVYKR
jgi:hypothetical protein